MGEEAHQGNSLVATTEVSHVVDLLGVENAEAAKQLNEFVALEYVAAADRAKLSHIMVKALEEHDTAGTHRATQIVGPPTNVALDRERLFPVLSSFAASPDPRRKGV